MDTFVLLFCQKFLEFQEGFHLIIIWACTILQGICFFALRKSSPLNEFNPKDVQKNDALTEEQKEGVLKYVREQKVIIILMAAVFIILLIAAFAFTFTFFAGN